MANTDTQTTIAECEALLAEMEGRGKDEEEEAAAETTGGLKSGTYLQASGDPKYIYCFNPYRFEKGHHYLHNFITGSSYNATDNIKKEGGAWILKPGGLSVITPARAMELFKAYHKLD